MGLLFVLASAAFAVAQSTSSGPSRVSARSGIATWKPIDPRAFVAAGCKPRAAITSGFFQLGKTFRGLRASPAFAECVPARSQIAVSGPLRPVGYVYLLYGSCDYKHEACQHPLEIQTWPECARDPNSYTPERGPSRGRQPVLNPSELVKIRTAPELPAASYNGGTRIELYGGGSTVVIFAPDAKLGQRAAQALAHAMFLRASPTTAARLYAEASKPGNAIACHHSLMSAVSSRGRQ